MKPTLPPQLPRSQPPPAPRTRADAPRPAPLAPRHPLQQPAGPAVRDRLRDHAGESPLRGLDALLQDGLGRAELPPALDLVAALEAAERFAPMADDAVPGLGRLVGAVIADERHKLSRLLDLGGR